MIVFSYLKCINYVFNYLVSIIQSIFRILIYINIEYMKFINSSKSYKNRYQEKWESRGSIRTRPRKFIDFNQKGYFFPENKQPLLLNSDIINLGQEVKETVLLQSFYKYLDDIVNLEIKLINSVCNKLIYSDLIVNYNDEVKLNAYTIIIDEYYHVYIARDMLLQLDRYFPKLQKFTYQESDACKAVALIKNQLGRNYHDIFEIIAVCIFETTLVRELVEYFNSKTIHPSVKCYINDHMNDEARHYTFFYDLLCYTWKNLPEDYKENIGKYLASFIKLYLNINSDKAFNLNLLNSILQDKERSTDIIENLYKGFDITPEIPIVKNVLSVLKKSELLENTWVKSSFQNIGWNL